MAKSGKMLHAGSSPGPGVRPRLARYLHMRHQLRLGLAFIAIVVVFGTTGYMLIERWGFLDSLFMTTITLSSVGYGETHPLHDSGRVFTIVLIMGGVAALGNLINQLAWAVSEGYFQEGINLRRRIKMISNLDQHYIVCGYGRIGQQIAKDLAAEGAPFVVIEKNPEQVRLVEEQGYPALVGDASTDQMLNQAGIERARCVLCALPSDAENLYIVLSAKLLNPKVVVISRSASAEGAAKLAKIGADRIVSPYLTGAKRMATLALRPQGVDLLDTLLVVPAKSTSRRSCSPASRSARSSTRPSATPPCAASPARSSWGFAAAPARSWEAHRAARCCMKATC